MNGSVFIVVLHLRPLTTQMLIPSTTDPCNNRLTREIGVQRYETLQHPSKASVDPDVDPSHHRYI
jgi:hypothetical protein